MAVEHLHTAGENVSWCHNGENGLVLASKCKHLPGDLFRNVYNSVIYNNKSQVTPFKETKFYEARNHLMSIDCMHK